MINQVHLAMAANNSLAVVVTAIMAFVITALSGIFLVPYLRRLKYGQTIKEIGPTWHKQKQGTPTMGGLMFMLGIVGAVLAGLLLMWWDDEQTLDKAQAVKLIAGLVMAIGFGILGYIDDYIKVVKKRNLGLRARDKLLGQLLLSCGYLIILQLNGVLSTIVEIPFFGQMNFGLLYYPLMVIMIVGFTNAVNLTDGIDGLASSVTFVFGLAFMIYSIRMLQPLVGVLSIALSAGCLGFLIWNFYPAKVFMGDTGSMFLGGCVVALAFTLDLPFLLFLGGIVYLCEAFSVILQVMSFKLTGKRIFKMSPIHHHFEMSGWSEVKIVMVFSAVTAVLCVIGYVSLPAS